LAVIHQPLALAHGFGSRERNPQQTGRFLILQKSFEIVEVRQPASFLSMKWHRNHASESADELRLEG
jgi:hypothetical protein